MASGGEQRSWRHLKMNAWGETPTRVLEDGTYSKFPVNATPLNERYEQLDQFWKRWKERPSFRVAYADGGSGLAELEHLRTDAKG